MRHFYLILFFFTAFIPISSFSQVTNDDVLTNEDTPISFSVTANDGPVDVATVDLDRNTVGRQIFIDVPGQGAFTVDDFGEVTFTPEQDWFGSISIEYEVLDLSAIAGSAFINVTVASVNDLPSAQNDSGITNENVPLTIAVLDNDSDVEGLDPATLDVNTGSAGIQTTFSNAGGTWNVVSGEVEFTPALNFTGSASTQYTVNDTNGVTTAPATIQVTVNNVNVAPVAVDDNQSTTQNIPVDITILSNDTDDSGLAPNSVDLDPASPGIQISLNLASGTFTVNSSGVVSYVPAPTFTGNATFNYTVNDIEGAKSNTALVTITVNAAPVPPVAVNDLGSGNEDTIIGVNVVANDTDVDGTINAATVDLDIATPGIQTSFSTANGNFTVSGGTVSFTPVANYNGIATVQYTVNDNSGLTSNAATVSITVIAVNDIPVANPDAATTPQNTPVALTVTTNDTDDNSIDAATVDLNPMSPSIQDSRSVPEGNFTVSTSGVVTFTPIPSFSGIVSISYSVRDNEGATSNSAAITITVNQVNVKPVANDDATTTNEDTPVTFNILTNDTDDVSLNAGSVDLDTNTGGIQTTISVTGGSFSVNSTGNLTFTPTANFTGSVTIQYTVNDNQGLTSDPANVTITVNNINDAPVAVNDVGSGNEDTTIGVNVVTNDTDSDGTIDASTVDLDIGTPGIQTSYSTANGNYTVSGGTVNYTPVANYKGIATLQYTVNDNGGLTSNAATITITVISVNDIPVANADATSTPQTQPVTLNVTVNDTDDGSIDAATVDLDPGTAGIQNSHSIPEGNFTVNNSGVVTFSPIASFSGVVSINYTVRDNEGATSNSAGITITVIRVNIKPVANNDGATIDEDSAITINILSNDTDDISLNAGSVDLDVNTSGIQTTRAVTGGSFSVNGTGNLTFTPTANYTGTATVRYTVNDNEGLTSDPATVTITINSINDVPVAVNDARTVNEDNLAVVNVLSNDYDSDGTLVINSVDLDPASSGTQTSHPVTGGNFSVDAGGIVTFTPDSNFNGTATANYTVTDNSGGISNTGTITISILAINDSPTASNDIVSTPQNVTIAFNIATNDSDVDGSVNAATIDLDPAVAGLQKTRSVAGGTYTVDNSGNVTFVPTSNFNGTSSITYTVQDNAAATSNVATITVLVSFVNQAPVANNDATTTGEETPVTVNLISNDTDDGSINAATVDLNQVLSGIQNTLSNSSGSFSISPAGVLTYTPAGNFNGTATISYTVNDNLGEISNTATVSITVNAINDIPVANNDNASGLENESVVINVIANDTDAENALNAASIDLDPAAAGIQSTLTTAKGTFTNNTTTGVVTFVPVANAFGVISITYTISDASGAKSNVATIQITINNINDEPYFDLIANQRVFKNADAKIVTITGISAGPGETEVLSLSASSANTSLVPNPTISYNGTATTATLTFKPQLNQFGSVDITVKLVDEGLKEFSRTFSITVVNAEIISDPVEVASAGILYQYEIKTNDIEETLSIIGLQIPAWATLTSTGKNTALLSGTPPNNATSSTVTIQLKNGNVVLDQQQFTLRINRPPTSASFDLQTNEDVGLILAANNFVAVYTDADDDPLERIQFTILPRHGTIELGSVPVVAGQEIPLTSLTNVTYKPLLDYSGKDTVYFKLGDAYSFSNESHIQFTVAPVNDPPVITFIEVEPMVFDIGTEIPKNFTLLFDANDVDNENLTSAVIGFRQPNFDPEHDVLLFANTPKITGVFDEDTGVLNLTGTATVAEYVAAIRSIQYNFEDFFEIIKISRVVYVSLFDGNSFSDEKERTINLIFNFVDLKIPNVFTPDGNGSYEVWPFTSDDNLEQFSTAIIRVFDIRGNMVHETIGFATPWDGKLKGQDVPAGTYFYTLDLKYGNIRYNGSLTILRAER
jgi:gliding motility-associated-like protein